MLRLDSRSFAGYTFGTWYPTGYIVALTPEYTDAERVQAALRQASVEDVQVWAAHEVLASYTAFQQQRSTMDQIAALLAADERAIQDDNLQAAQEGYTFVTIPVSDPARLEDMRHILVTHQIRRAHYYGRYTMIDLIA